MVLHALIPCMVDICDKGLVWLAAKSEWKRKSLCAAFSRSKVFDKWGISSVYEGDKSSSTRYQPEAKPRGDIMVRELFSARVDARHHACLSRTRKLNYIRSLQCHNQLHVAHRLKIEYSTSCIPSIQNAYNVWWQARATLCCPFSRSGPPALSERRICLNFALPIPKKYCQPTDCE